MQPRVFRMLLMFACTMIPIAAHGTDLTLTAAGTADGFTISTFASGFPEAGSIGPLGIAFTSTGGVLVTDYPGNVRLFATDTDGQSAAAAPVGQSYGGSNAVGLAQVGANIYMTQQANASVVQINPTGTFNQLIVSGIPSATGIVADPANGHLFVSQGGFAGAGIFDVNPLTKTFSLFVAATGIDGLTISADGSTLYGANAFTGHLLGWNTATGTQVFDSGFIPGGVDGSALGTGSLAGNIFVNTNSGTVFEVNLNTLAQTLIASGGTRGDFVMVDPSNGSLLLTQSGEIDRLTAPAGGGFGGGGGAVPEPSSLLLLGSGLAGLATWRGRRNG